MEVETDDKRDRKLVQEENINVQTKVRDLPVLQFVSSCCCCEDVDEFLQERTLFFPLFVAAWVSSSTVPLAVLPSSCCRWAEAEDNDFHAILVAGINSHPANLQPMNPEKPQRQSVEVVTRHHRQEQGERKGQGKRDIKKKRKKYIVWMYLLHQQ